MHATIEKTGVFYVVHAVTVSMQLLGKRLSTTIEELFSAWAMTRSYLHDNWRYSLVESSGVEC
jgi:hypothetical protein